mgnify:CR=1 FL=1
MDVVEPFGEVMTMLRATLQASVIAAAGNQVILRELAAIQVALAHPGGTTDASETMRLRALVLQNASRTQQESVNQLWSDLCLLQTLGPGPSISILQESCSPEPQ